MNLSVRRGKVIRIREHSELSTRPNRKLEIFEQIVDVGIPKVTQCRLGSRPEKQRVRERWKTEDEVFTRRRIIDNGGRIQKSCGIYFVESQTVHTGCCRRWEMTGSSKMVGGGC